MPSTNNNEVRLAQFWLAVVARLVANVELRKPLVSTALKPAIYLIDDDFTQPEGNETAPWGRVVVVPTESLFTNQNDDDPRHPRRVDFLIRCEVNNFRAKGYSKSLALEAAQADVYTSLYLWAPATQTFAITVRPLFRWQAPQQTPQYDEGRSLWYTSSGWRSEVIAPPSGS